MEKENISYDMRDYIGLSSSSSSSSSVSSALTLVGAPSGSAPSGSECEEKHSTASPLDLNPNETELRLGFGPPQLKNVDEYPAFTPESAPELELVPSVSSAKVVLPCKRSFAEALGNSQDVNIAAPSSSSPNNNNNNNNNTTSHGPWMTMPTPPLFGSLFTRPPRVPQVPASNNFSTPPPKFDASLDQNNASAKRCVVGWPPIRSFRKNTTVSAPLKPSATDTTPLDEDGSKVPMDKDPNPDSVTLFVKANMDGVPIGRKLDLKSYDDYDNLKKGVAQMFQPFINGHRGGHNEDSSMNNTQVDLLFEGSEYVLTHEDKDGDWMLVGDVPWGMFLSTVKRLRIMRSSDAIGLGQHLSAKNASKH